MRRNTKILLILFGILCMVFVALEKDFFWMIIREQRGNSVPLEDNAGISQAEDVPSSSLVAPPLATNAPSVFELTRKTINLNFQVRPADESQMELFYEIGTITKNGEVMRKPQEMGIDSKTGAFKWFLRKGSGDYVITIKARPVPSGKESTLDVPIAIVPLYAKESIAYTGTEDPVGLFVQSAFAEGTAVGYSRIDYVNGDYEHSPIPKAFAEARPGLTVLDYSSFFGLYGRATVANASVASANPCGSVGCKKMQIQDLAQIAFDDFTTANFFTVYPAHYDSAPNYTVDTYPGNWIYVRNSPGSSWSDMPIVMRFIDTIAAFRPEVFEELLSTGTLGNALAMIERYARFGRTEDYLSPKAHPTTFGTPEGMSDQEYALAMVKMANGIQKGHLPPVSRLALQDFPSDNHAKKIFVTPGSIAMAQRPSDVAQQYIVNAADSFDLQGIPLRHIWVVTHGDPNTIKITPLAADSSVIALDIPYPKDMKFEGINASSPTVHIAHFAYNGEYFSAPSFFTVLAKEDL